MAFSFDFTADFFTLDNLQPLTLRISGQADQAIAKALNEPADWTDPDQAGGQVLEGDQQWIWPIVFTPTKPPLGAVLIDQWGAAYTVLSVKRVDAVQVWEARGRNLSVVYGLNNVAAVLEATYTQSPCGEALPTWKTVLSGIAARFQPVEQEAQILEDAEWPKTTYHVILGTDIFAPEIPVEPASADYRLVDRAGRHYRIMKYTRAARIDALAVAECVLIIDGAEGNAVDRLASEDNPNPMGGEMSDLGTISGATGLESAINLIWAGNAPLNAAVPADRLIAGRVPPSEKMPYVRLEAEGGQETQRTSGTLYAREKVVFHIWSDGVDSGRAVWPLIRNAFASMAFDWGSGGVLDMKWDGPPPSRQTSNPEIKAWQTTVSFTCATWQSRQDNTSSSSGS